MASMIEILNKKKMKLLQLAWTEPKAIKSQVLH